MSKTKWTDEEIAQAFVDGTEWQVMAAFKQLRTERDSLERENATLGKQLEAFRDSSLLAKGQALLEARAERDALKARIDRMIEGKDIESDALHSVHDENLRLIAERDAALAKAREEGRQEGFDQAMDAKQYPENWE